MRPLREGDVLVNPEYGKIRILKDRMWEYIDKVGRGGPLPEDYPRPGSNWKLDEDWIVGKILTKYRAL